MLTEIPSLIEFQDRGRSTSSSYEEPRATGNDWRGRDDRASSSSSNRDYQSYPPPPPPPSSSSSSSSYNSSSRTQGSSSSSSGTSSYVGSYERSSSQDRPVRTYNAPSSSSEGSWSDSRYDSRGDQRSDYSSKEMRSDSRPPRSEPPLPLNDRPVERRDYSRDVPRDSRDVSRDSRDVRDNRDSYRDPARYESGSRQDPPPFRSDRSTPQRTDIRDYRDVGSRSDSRSDHRSDFKDSDFDSHRPSLQDTRNLTSPRDSNDIRDRRLDGPTRYDRSGNSETQPKLNPMTSTATPPQYRSRPSSYTSYDRDNRSSSSSSRPSENGDGPDLEGRRGGMDSSSRDPPRDPPRDSSRDPIRDSRDSSRDSIRDNMGSRRSNEATEPRREVIRDSRDIGDSGPRDSGIDVRDTGRDSLRDNRDGGRDGGRNDLERRRLTEPGPRDSPNRGPRPEPSGGRPPLEYRQQNHRPSILGGQQQQQQQQHHHHHNHHQRPSITAPMRQYDTPSRRMDSSYTGNSSRQGSSSAMGSYNSDSRGSRSSSDFRPGSPSRVSASNQTSSQIQLQSISSTSNSESNNTESQQTHFSSASNQSTNPTSGFNTYSPFSNNSTDPANSNPYGSGTQSTGGASTTVAMTNAGESSSSSSVPPAPALPSKTELLIGIEEKEDAILEVSKQVERWRKEREQLAKEVQTFENTKNRGKLLHLVPGLPIRPELLSMNPADLITETYEHNVRLSTRSDQAVLAQLWDADIRPKYIPFINFLKSTSKQFRYLAIATENQQSAQISPFPSPAPSGSTSEANVKRELGTDESADVAQSSKMDTYAHSSSTTPNHSQSAQSAQMLDDDIENTSTIATATSSNGMQVDEVASNSTTSAIPAPIPCHNSGDPSKIVDGEYLPPLSLSDVVVEIDETTFFDPVTSPDVSDYSFYADNQVLHEQMKELMVSSIQERRAEIVARVQKDSKAHRKATLAWYRRLQVEKEEEATRKLLQNKKWLHVAQSGRKSSVRVSARASEPPSSPSAPGSGSYSMSASGTTAISMSSGGGGGRRRLMSSSGSALAGSGGVSSSADRDRDRGSGSGGGGGGGGGGGSNAGDDEYDDEEDEERFESTRAEVPPMLQYDEFAEYHRNFDFVDNDGSVEDSRQIDQDIKIQRPWHPAEEDIFVRAFLRFHKDFAKIQSYLPGKSLQEIIWFYYTRKNKLDLKRRWQREGINQLQLLNLGLSALTPSDPAAATLAHYMGSAVEWVNGTSRRGSLRLLEKGTSTSKPPGSAPLPDQRHRMEDYEVEIEKSLHDSGNYSPGRPVSTSFGETQNRWTAEEREKFKSAFDVHYKDFKAIADIMRTKNAAQCKNYYHNNKKKLGLPSTLSRSGTIASDTSRPSPPISPPPTQSSKTSTGPLDGVDNSMDVDQPEDSISGLSSLRASASCAPNKDSSSDALNASLGGVPSSSDGGAKAENLKTSLELAAPTPKRGAAARINTSHWTDEEKAKFKALLQVHGKDWKALASGIPSKTVNQIKNFFQNYRTKLKLDELLPESDRNASSTRGGRGKKRKIKPRGRPKKAGGGSGGDSGNGGGAFNDDDGSDYLDDSDASGPESDESSGYEEFASAAPLATATVGVNEINFKASEDGEDRRNDQFNVDDETDKDHMPRASGVASGKRKRSETLESEEELLLDTAAVNEAEEETTAPNTVVDDQTMEEEEEEVGKTTSAATAPAKRGGRGRGRGGGTRGSSSSVAIATPPPTKKPKLSSIPLEEDEATHEQQVAGASDETSPKSVAVVVVVVVPSSSSPPSSMIVDSESNHTDEVTVKGDDDVDHHHHHEHHNKVDGETQNDKQSPSVILDSANDKSEKQKNHVAIDSSPQSSEMDDTDQRVTN
jgi:hypothetical protein